MEMIDPQSDRVLITGAAGRSAPLCGTGCGRTGTICG
jgi:hypothetical protein